jgi:hypothetical protein
MKKFLLILTLFVAFQISAKAQPGLSVSPDLRPASMADTILSVALGDSIIVQHGAIEIQPVIVNEHGDSARSVSFNAFDVKADSTQGCNTYVQLFDKNCNVIATKNQLIPAAILNQWKSDPSVMFTYILSFNPRYKKP